MQDGEGLILVFQVTIKLFKIYLFLVYRGVIFDPIAIVYENYNFTVRSRPR